MRSDNFGHAPTQFVPETLVFVSLEMSDKEKK